MEYWVMAWVNAYGYLGIGALIVAENLFPPIPSEVILTFGGFLTTYTRLTAFGVIVAATIGSVLGAIALYYVGRLLSWERLERLVDGRLGKLLHFKKENMKKAIGWFDRRGNLAVFLCRCVPVVRSLISIPAGMAGMNMRRFLLYTTAGSAVWNTVLVLAGRAAGVAWPTVVGIVGRYTGTVLWTAGIFAALVGGIWMVRRKKR